MNEAQEILEWYVAAGVDALLEEKPVDRFAETKDLLNNATAASKRVQRQPAAGQAGKGRQLPRGHQQSEVPPRANMQSTTLPNEAAIASAREKAASCNSLDALRAALENFDGCNLKRTAKSTVFADGNPQARIMLIGEVPDKDEDLQGLPFVGRAGQLLDNMLKAIGLDRQTAYMTNIIAWRPPGNRAPTPQETEICRPFVERHIELVNPELVVMLGGGAAKTLLKATGGIMRLRGKWLEIETAYSKTKAMPTFHPAHLLQQPGQKSLAWQDLLAIKASLDNG